MHCYVILYTEIYYHLVRICKCIEYTIMIISLLNFFFLNQFDSKRKNTVCTVLSEFIIYQQVVLSEMSVQRINIELLYNFIPVNLIYN